MSTPYFEELVEGAAKSRNEPPVPRRFITEAIERIKEGKEEVPRYVTGRPTLKSVYDIAVRLEADASVKN